MWARWNDELDQRYTLGVEEELMLLEPADWSLAQSSDAVLPRLSDELSPHASPERHAAVLELATGIHLDVDGAVAELLDAGVPAAPVINPRDIAFNPQLAAWSHSPLVRFFRGLPTPRKR